MARIQKTQHPTSTYNDKLRMKAKGEIGMEFSLWKIFSLITCQNEQLTNDVSYAGRNE